MTTQPRETRAAHEHAVRVRLSLDQSRDARCWQCGDRARAAVTIGGVPRMTCEAHRERPGDIEAPFAPSWTGRARCADHPPADGQHAGTYADRYCVRCPVSRECARYSAELAADTLGLAYTNAPAAGLSGPELARLTPDEAEALSAERLFERAMEVA